MQLIRGRDHRLVQDNLGAWLKRGDEVLQDPYAVLVGPVVEDGPEKVNVGAVYRLLGKEVVYGVLDPVGNVCRSLLLGFFDDRFIKILKQRWHQWELRNAMYCRRAGPGTYLDDKLQGWKRACNGDGNSTM